MALFQSLRIFKLAFVNVKEIKKNLTEIIPHSQALEPLFVLSLAFFFGFDLVWSLVSFYLKFE